MNGTGRSETVARKPLQPETSLLSNYDRRQVVIVAWVRDCCESNSFYSRGVQRINALK